jgi:UDP-2,4-diacetamido-2,4,6-trideoxy-beta-L-altropyranose hydrolase
MSLSFRRAQLSDTDLLFAWANDPLVRSNSYNNNPIVYQDHVKWMESCMGSEDCTIYIFEENRVPAGQVRISKSKTGEIIIGISIDKNFRGKSLGADMIRNAVTEFAITHPGNKIYAYIKKENVSSYKVFEKAGFTLLEMVEEQNIQSYKMIFG